MEPHDSGDKITLGYLLLCLDQLEFRVRFEPASIDLWRKKKWNFPETQ